MQPQLGFGWGFPLQELSPSEQRRVYSLVGAGGTSWEVSGLDDGAEPWYDTIIVELSTPPPPEPHEWMDKWVNRDNACPRPSDADITRAFAELGLNPADVSFGYYHWVCEY